MSRARSALALIALTLAGTAATAAWQSTAPIEDYQVQLPKPRRLPIVPGAGPAGRDGDTWRLNAVYRSNFPSLSYMSLDGGRITFDLWCRYRGAVILVRMEPWRLNQARIELRSGAFRLRARLRGDGKGDGPFFVGAVLSENDPALRNFGLTGKLAMRLGGGKIVHLDAVDRSERTTVRRFFELCYEDRPNEPELPWRERPAAGRATR
jgi:hypothetical protein